jgi:hypothetical protein
MVGKQEATRIASGKETLALAYEKRSLPSVYWKEGPSLDEILGANTSSTQHNKAHMAFTLFRMNLARWANLSVLKVSLKQLVEGLTLAIMMVLALPPRESCRQKRFWVNST